MHAQDTELNVLENNDFVGLDATIQLFSQEIDDDSFIALWDLVISHAARSFVTCTSYRVGSSCPGAENVRFSPFGNLRTVGLFSSVHHRTSLRKSAGQHRDGIPFGVFDCSF